MKRLKAIIPVLLSLWLAAAIFCPVSGQTHSVSQSTNVVNIAEIKTKAEKGDAVAQNNLGLMYQMGEGVAKDDAEALKWYRKAAEQGLADAQFNLGRFHTYGLRMAADSVKAMKWYRKAADQGHSVAQRTLGEMYERGEEKVPKDYAEAVKWYRKAAEQGDVGAQYNLGLMYTTGEGVPRDYAEAVKWYRKAADQGYSPAQCILGGMCENGEGVAKDEAEAVKWYRKAAELGDSMAQHTLGCMCAKSERVVKGKVNEQRLSDPLSVRIVPQMYQEKGGGSIALQHPPEHFHVIITNTSDKSVRLWREWCSWGYYTLSFEVSDKNGKTTKIRKAPTGWTRNFPSSITIPPGDHMVFEVSFDMKTWPTAPLPQKGQFLEVKMKAVFQIPEDDETKERKVWTGRVSSPEHTYTIYRETR